MLKRRVCIQRSASNMNSAPNIEIRLHVVPRLWWNGTSSNRYSENRGFPLFFKNPKSGNSLKKTAIHGKVQIELWPWQHLLSNTDPCACQYFKRKHLTNSVHLHTHNKQIESTYCALICISSRNEIFQIPAAEVKEFPVDLSSTGCAYAPFPCRLETPLHDSTRYICYQDFNFVLTNVCFARNKLREMYE
jgi:hypothetical protein